MIKEFRGEYRFLSNFWPCKITFEGIEYPSVENFYVAMKTKDLTLRNHISNIAKPGDVKRFGRGLDIREDWEQVKLPMMEEGLRQKFANPGLKNMLLATGDQELVEGNTWGDVFWGVDLRKGKGENHLGKLLMKIRDELKAKV